MSTLVEVFLTVFGLVFGLVFGFGLAGIVLFFIFFGLMMCFGRFREAGHRRGKR